MCIRDSSGAVARPLAGVYAVHDRLAAEPALAGLRTAVLHGRLDADAKDRVMTAFARGEIDVLVATTAVSYTHLDVYKRQTQ